MSHSPVVRPARTGGFNINALHPAGMLDAIRRGRTECDSDPFRQAPTIGGSKLDYVFFDERWTKISCQVHESRPAGISDHRLVVATATPR